jgi:glycogen debranching enzyme
LLGNKRGLMVHLPAANGANPKSIHRSKWYGATRQGRKFLEAIVCRQPDGAMLSRRLQTRFLTDGITARRDYDGGTPVTERYFVPDHLPALMWSQLGGANLAVELYLHLRFQRGGAPKAAYEAALESGSLIVCRDVELIAGPGPEGIDTGGTPQPTDQTLWVACRVDGGEMTLLESRARSRPMWYSLDAARRRYLRRLAAQRADIVEHAPLWELASDWVYSPVAIQSQPGCTVAMGFGSTRTEALEAATLCLDRGQELELEKRERLSSLLEHSWFSTGHAATDSAYGHVLSRLSDALIVESDHDEGDGSGAPTLLAGNAYFQESWKRDENVALGGVLAVGLYDLARGIIDATWGRQDDSTGRIPLRLRAGEIPGYTSSDGTLWALVRLAQYTSLTGDVEMLRTKSDMISHFFRRSLALCTGGLLPSGSIAVQGHEWETWMDTEFSARSGFPIEIQLLWLTCLLTYADRLEPELGLAMRAMAEQTRASLELFDRGDYFVDHLTAEMDQVDLLTPNAYFWNVLDLGFDWQWEERSLAHGRRELGGISGIRTLARSQWERVLGPEIAALARADRPLPSAGKINYHRGVEWNWLSQFFVAGHLRHGHPDMAYDHFLARQIYDATCTAGLGGVSEVFDHRGPAGPNFQTWSMSGLLESLHRFLGVTVDVPNRIIAVRPLKPRRWPHLKARKWYGGTWLDVEYVTQRNQQELSLEFAELPVDSPEIQVELPLPRGRALRRVTVESETGSEDVTARIALEEQPDRAVLTLRSRRRQRIRMLM